MAEVDYTDTHDKKHLIGFKKLKKRIIYHFYKTQELLYTSVLKVGALFLTPN